MTTQSSPAPSLWSEAPAEPCPKRFNAAAYCVAASAARFPEKDALIVVDGDAPERQVGRWSFSEMDQAVRRAAGALRAAGVEQGDRVLIRLGDGPEFPIAYFGAIAAGAVAMPLSAQLSAAELARIAADAEPKIALLAEDAPEFDRGAARRLSAEDLAEGAPADIADTGAEDPALLVYTSGSGGTPKGVLHAQRAFWARRMMHAGWHGVAERDRVMHAGAFNWTYTLGVGLSDPWSVGATAILNAGSRAPEAWPPLIRQWRPTVFAAVPGVFRRVLKYGGAALAEDVASLERAVTAGEKLLPEILEEWEQRTGKPLLEALGMSELSTYISAASERRPGPGFAGWPQPGRRIAILDEQGQPAPRGVEGALAAHRSDPGLMLGYWRRAEETDAAMQGEWFLSGDRALMREDGAVAYMGRADDQMNAQGYRVAPQEVEEAFAAHPDVAECAAAELLVKSGVSIIALWITPAGAASPSRAELLAHGEARLASYKLPREFFVADALPKSANGKLLRRKLLELGAEKLT